MRNAVWLLLFKLPPFFIIFFEWKHSWRCLVMNKERYSCLRIQKKTVFTDLKFSSLEEAMDSFHWWILIAPWAIPKASASFPVWPQPHRSAVTAKELSTDEGWPTPPRLPHQDCFSLGNTAQLSLDLISTIWIHHVGVWVSPSLPHLREGLNMASLLQPRATHSKHCGVLMVNKCVCHLLWDPKN